MSITVAKFLDVADGTQPGQFTIGEREPVATLADLDPVYKRLLDEPVTAIIAVTGADGQPNLTPVWFDYEGDVVLLNLATHRKKVGWLRKTPYATYVRSPTMHSTPMRVSGPRTCAWAHTAVPAPISTPASISAVGWTATTRRPRRIARSPGRDRPASSRRSPSTGIPRR